MSTFGDSAGCGNLGLEPEGLQGRGRGERGTAEFQIGFRLPSRATFPVANTFMSGQHRTLLLVHPHSSPHLDTPRGHKLALKSPPSCARFEAIGPVSRTYAWRYSKLLWVGWNGNGWDGRACEWRRLRVSLSIRACWSDSVCGVCHCSVLIDVSHAS